jgi:hypothetical protein
MWKPEEVEIQTAKAAEIKESFRAGIRSAIENLPQDKKALAEKSKAVADAEARYRGREFPANAASLYNDLRRGDDFITLVEGAIETWNRIGPDSVADPLGRFAVDPNCIDRLVGGLEATLRHSGKHKTIRQQIATLLEVLAFEDSELKRLGAADGLWTIPPAPVSDTPRPVHVETKHDPLK